MSRTIFSLLKIPILSHKPLRIGAQPKHRHFNQTLLFFDSKSHSRYKDCMTDVAFIRSIPVLYTKKSVPMQFFSSRLYSQKGQTFMTSDFDACEIDLDMQMSFLNAAPLRIDLISMFAVRQLNSRRIAA